MKKIRIFMLIARTRHRQGTMSFAGVLTNPAEVYADPPASVSPGLAPSRVPRAPSEPGQGNGFYEAFVAANLAGKTAIIEGLVADGTLKTPTPFSSIFATLSRPSSARPTTSSSDSGATRKSRAASVPGKTPRE